MIEDEEILICNEPGSFTQTGFLKLYSISLAWYQNGASSFDVEYGIEGFELGSGYEASTNESNVLLTNLIAGTTYDIYVKANCSESNSSNYIGPIAAETLICYPPDYSFENVGQTSMSLIYYGTYESEPKEEIVEYGIEGFTLGTGIERIFNHDIFISGLEPRTTYDFYSYTKCGETISDIEFRQNRTLDDCLFIENFEAVDIGSNEIFFDWDRPLLDPWGGVLIYWEMEGFPIGSGTGGVEFFYEPTEGTIGGLLPSTTYEFYYRTDCGPLIGYSSYGGPLVVTTNP